MRFRADSMPQRSAARFGSSSSVRTHAMPLPIITSSIPTPRRTALGCSFAALNMPQGVAYQSNTATMWSCGAMV